MLTVNEIRSSFLKFFESKGHKIVKSSSLIPINDDSLLFTTAGMVQFKNYFTGAEKPKFTKATSSQKCVRAGGKNCDIENVGYTARHHTFFEMLGNFSFGDYFKTKAIPYAWEFLTEVLKLDKSRLLVTIYHTDEEAYNIWHKVVGLPENRIIRIPTDDNYWSMGDTGPCGPCSEIFYDQGEEVEGGKPGTLEEDGDRYIEVWNIVFMQFEKFADGTKKPLPKPSIDTGMGLERIANILQGVGHNYKIDIFTKIIANSKAIIGEGDITSHRVIADHLRASSFLIADGLLPSNEGRGYVLRRIMRRAMRHIHQLGAKESCMYKLVPTLVDVMGGVYPELKDAEPLIMETLKNEEDRFRTTLDKGLKILNKEIEGLDSGGTLSGEIAFKLYDTYGFPLDLTQDILRQKHISVDTAIFAKKMEEQKKMAKASWVGSGDCKVSQLYFDIKEKTGATEFVGYEKNTQTAKILSLIVDGKEVKKAVAGQTIEMIVDKTSFYGECGGQVGDSGLAIKSSEDGAIPLPFAILEIKNTKRPLSDLFIHEGKVENGTLQVGDYVNLGIDLKRRKKIKANHSSCHLMHYALRKLIGKTLTQKGSYVDEHRLRFDVSCNRIITKAEIQEVERIVNDLIIKNTPITTEVLDLKEAKKKGAVALFGEKYDDKVRVISMGAKEGKHQEIIDVKNAKTEHSMEDVQKGLQSLSKTKSGDNCSVEFCGGTHAERTGDIGLFKIISEGAISAGVRRIEAITGLEALNYVHNQLDIVDGLVGLTNSAREQLVERVAGLMKENKKFRKGQEKLDLLELLEIKFRESIIKNYIKVKDNKGVAKITKIRENGIKFASRISKDISPKKLKSLIIDKLNKEYNDNAVIVSISEYQSKITAIVGISKNLEDKLNAEILVKKAVEVLEGNGGGGRVGLGMGGGRNFLKAEEAIEAVKKEGEKVLN